MSKRYEWSEASMTTVVSQLAADVDDDGTPGYAVVIGDPYATAFVVCGSVAELAAFAVKVTDAVRGLAPHAHLTDAQLAEQLGDALNALDAPDEPPTTGDEDDPLGVVRSLVTEARDRLPAEEFGPLCKHCAGHG